jgi:ElaB/YqjD/DUF883 family membrane-anchored ribosome-binding protein
MEINMSSTETMARKSAKESNESRECNMLQPWDDLVAYARKYVREEPETAAWVCLGVGFILGWKLKPW